MTIRRSIRRFTVAAAASTAIIAGLHAPAALAADGASITVTGGSLSITAPLAGDFAGVTRMGAYDFTQAATPLTLSVPGNVYAKTYRSDLTVSVVTGP